MCLVLVEWKRTYNDKDELEDGTGDVPSPVRVTEESSKKRKYVNCACPLAHVVRCFGILLTHHSRQKQHQIHSHSKECQCCKPLVHCYTNHTQLHK